MNCETLMLIVGIYFACKVFLLVFGLVARIILAVQAERERSNEVAEIVETFLRKNE